MSNPNLSALLQEIDTDRPRAAIQQIDAFAQQLDPAADAALLQELRRLTGQLSLLVANALLQADADMMEHHYHAEFCCGTVVHAAFDDCSRRRVEPGPVLEEIHRICARLRAS